LKTPDGGTLNIEDTMKLEDLLWPVVFASLTALFWGMYGPAIGQARNELTSPFKPYVAIGVAYLIWGILGGLGGMAYKGDNYSFSGAGSLWGLIGGSLGAWGALTLTLAMFNGGKPHFVMPIVFGGAVTVTAIISVLTVKTEEQVSPFLWLGMFVVAVGIVLVAVNTPHAAPPKKPTAVAPENPTADPGAP
jgi:drug/metabolite transporter (DMT)-like permease